MALALTGGAWRRLAWRSMWRHRWRRNNGEKWQRREIMAIQYHMAST